MVEGNKLDQKIDPECKLVTDITNPEEIHYWYNDEGKAGEDEQNNPTSCTLTAAQKLALDDQTNMIAYGTLNSGVGAQTITAEELATVGNQSGDEAENATEKIYNPDGSTKNPLKGRTLNTENMPTKYYYLVVQYPNKYTNQNLDKSQKDISVSLKVTDSSAVATVRSAL